MIEVNAFRTLNHANLLKWLRGRAILVNAITVKRES